MGSAITNETAISLLSVPEVDGLPEAPTAAPSGPSAIVYCDGGAKPNPGKGAWGLWAVDSNGQHYNGWGYVGDMVTNNRAELYACIECLKMIRSLGWVLVDAYFDSRYVLDGVTIRIFDWVKNGWLTAEGNKIANLAEWKEIHALVLELQAKGVIINGHWVKGHSGVPGNEQADANATRGRLAGEKGSTEAVIGRTDTTVKQPKPKAADMHRMVAGRRMIFNTNTPMRTADGYYVYYSANFDDAGGKQGKDFGAEAPDDLNAVVVTKEAIAQIDSIITHQNHITPDDFVQPVLILKERVVKPHVWKMLTEHGHSHLSQERLNVLTVEGEPLTIYVRPPRRAYDGIAILDELFERLDVYRHQSDQLKQEYIDITDQIYTKGKKDWKVKDTIAGSDKAVTVPIAHQDRELNLKLTFNIDLPQRNTLSALGKTTNDMKVVLVKYSQMETNFRYAVILETDNDYAIYATSYANLKVV